MAALKRSATELDGTTPKPAKKVRSSTDIATSKSTPRKTFTKDPVNGSKDESTVKKPYKAAGTKHHTSRNGDESGKSAGEKGFKLATSSAEAHAAQRALAKQRKESKPNADIVARSKKLWERLRRQSHVEKEERDQLVAELYAIINGRVRDFVFKHDSVRVIQCAVKYANKEQRLNITKELRTDMRELVESKYGKFMVAKIVVEGDQEVRDLVIPQFYGHIRRLINHPEAAWIVDDIYRGVATPEQKSFMLREWYGAEFALENKIKDDALKTTIKPTADLAEILQQSPEKRKPIMSFLGQLINQLVQKKMTGFTMLHDAMLQYFTNLPVGSEEAGEFMENLRSDLDEESGGGDLLKNLAFTKSGSRVVCLALAYGNAKTRKQILRVYREHMEMMAMDQHAYKVLLIALEVTDDTKTSSSMVYSELLHENTKDDEERAAKIAELLMHRTARILLVYPLAGRVGWLIPADLAPLLDEVYAIRESTSKKAPTTRHAELAKYSATALLATVTNAIEPLSTSITGCQATTEILLSSPAHVEQGGDLTGSAVEAVTALCGGDPSEEGHISSFPAGGKMLRTLCQGGRFDKTTGAIVKAEPDVEFAQKLYGVIEGHLLAWATGPSSFVVVALIEGLPEKSKGTVLKKLEQSRKQLTKAVQGKGDAKGNAGAKILLDKLPAR